MIRAERLLANLILQGQLARETTNVNREQREHSQNPNALSWVLVNNQINAYNCIDNKILYVQSILNMLYSTLIVNGLKPLTAYGGFF
jgi:hypothetical protein